LNKKSAQKQKASKQRLLASRCSTKSQTIYKNHKKQDQTKKISPKNETALLAKGCFFITFNQNLRLT
jgi:hypothetical protein